MSNRTIRKRNADGTYLNEGKVARNITLDPDIVESVARWAKRHGYRAFSNAVEALLYYGLKERGCDVRDLPEPESQCSTSGDGNTVLSASPINANTADNAMSATQIGNSNRNVNVKKNHDKPVRPSKRRK